MVTSVKLLKPLAIKPHSVLPVFVNTTFGATSPMLPHAIFQATRVLHGKMNKAVSSLRTRCPHQQYWLPTVRSPRFVNTTFGALNTANTSPHTNRVTNTPTHAQPFRRPPDHANPLTGPNQLAGNVHGPPHWLVYASHTQGPRSALAQNECTNARQKKTSNQAQFSILFYLYNHRHASTRTTHNKHTQS